MFIAGANKLLFAVCGILMCYAIFPLLHHYRSSNDDKRNKTVVPWLLLWECPEYFFPFSPIFLLNCQIPKKNVTQMFPFPLMNLWLELFDILPPLLEHVLRVDVCGWLKIKGSFVVFQLLNRCQNYWNFR